MPQTMPMHALRFAVAAALLVGTYAAASFTSEPLTVIAPHPSEFELSAGSRVERGGVWAQLPTPPPADTPLTLYFGLYPQNMAQIERVALDVSDPLSPNYGRHLNADAIASIVSPPARDIDTALAFLRSFDGTPDAVEHRLLATRHMIRARASVGAWERVLHTTLHHFQHTANPNKPPIIRKLGPHALPASVARVVQHITHIADVPPRRKGQRRALSPKQSVPGAFGACPAGVPPDGTAPAPPFVFVSTTGPAPTQALIVSGYVICGNGVIPLQSLSECGEGGALAAPILSTQLTLTLTDPFGNNTSWSPAAVLTAGPTACANDGNALLCTWNTNLLVPLSMGVSASMTISYNMTVLGQPQTVTLTTGGCFIMPQFAMSTPQFLAQHYGLPLGARVQDPRTSQAVYASGDSYAPSDLLAAGAALGLEMGQVTLAIDNQFPQFPGGEASLDLQIMLSVTRNATTWFWNLPNDPSFSVVTADILDDLGGTPLLLSMSYGGNEGPDSVSPGESLAAANFAMLATTNHTIITASGDNGVMGNGCGLSGNCSQCCWPQNVIPEFPATSPYVVAVGATQIGNAGWNALLTQSLGILSPVTAEIMCGAATSGVITSGGGYSAMYPALPFQFEPVASYLQRPYSSSGSWPPSQNGVQMRAFPDVAMSGANFPVFVGGQMNIEFGTSASTPLFASLVTLINDARLRNGLPPMGYIVPFLYHVAKNYPDAFTDIILGDNSAAPPANGGPCSTPLRCPTGGLHAAPGWDATTGLGSARFERLLAYALTVNHDFNINAAMANGGGPMGPAGLAGPRGVNGSQGVAGPAGRDGSDSAKTTATVALVLAAVGWAVAIAALFMARRTSNRLSTQPAINTTSLMSGSQTPGGSTPFVRISD